MWLNWTVNNKKVAPPPPSPHFYVNASFSVFPPFLAKIFVPPKWLNFWKIVPTQWGSNYVYIVFMITTAWFFFEAHTFEFISVVWFNSASFPSFLPPFLAFWINISYAELFTLILLIVVKCSAVISFSQNFFWALTQSLSPWMSNNFCSSVKLSYFSQYFNYFLDWYFPVFFVKQCSNFPPDSSNCHGVYVAIIRSMSK